MMLTLLSHPELGVVQLSCEMLLRQSYPCTDEAMVMKKSSTLIPEIPSCEWVPGSNLGTLLGACFCCPARGLSPPSPFFTTPKVARNREHTIGLLYHSLPAQSKR